MPEIFDALEITPPGKNQEIQLTDALQVLLKEQTMSAYEFEGMRYDTGTPPRLAEGNNGFCFTTP